MSNKTRPNNKQKSDDILALQAIQDSKMKNLRPSILGMDDTIDFKGISYEARGYADAAKKGNWSKWSLPVNMAQLAYDQQSPGEIAYDMVVGGMKQTGAGFLDSIAAWDATSITESTYRNGEVEYANWLNRLAAGLKKSTREENQIYQNPNGSMWNGAYFANQAQQLGYTAGIIAEMFVENALLDAVTGGAFAGASAAKGARLFANIGKDAMFGMAQGIKEAHMNAQETQNAVFQKFIEAGFTEEEALKKSKDAAKLHFKTESTALMGINALQNVAFLGSLARGARGVAKNAFAREGDKMSLGISDAFQNAGEAVVGAITPNKTIQKIAGWGLLAGSESIEEGVQYGIGKYAEMTTMGEDFKVSDVFEGTELRDSMVGGALGGVLMGAGFKGIAAYRNKDFNKNYKTFIEDSINFSNQTFTAEAEARRNFNELAAEVDKNPTPENLKKLQQLNIKLQEAKHNSSITTAINSLNFDYAKGTGSTVAFDMHIAHMENVLEAVQNKDTEKLKDLGLIDIDTGKERFEGSFKTILETFQTNIDNANKIKDLYSKTLGVETNDFKVATDIVLAKYNSRNLNEMHKKNLEELDVLFASDEVYKSLSPTSKERFKLESELAGISRYVEDQSNPLVVQRKNEIKEKLENLPNYEVKEKALLGSEINRDSAYVAGFGNTMNLILATNEATSQVSKVSDPENIKKKAKTSAEESINKAQTKEEVNAAIREAKYHDVYTSDLQDLAKTKLKNLKSNAVAKKVAKNVTTDTPTTTTPTDLALGENKPEPEKVEKPTPSIQEAVSLFGSGMKLENVSNPDGPSEQDVNAALADSAESLSADAFNSEENSQELKEIFSEIYAELQEELGRVPSHEDLVRKFIRSYGKEEVKRYLPGLEKASTLLGKEVTDTSFLFDSIEKGRTLLQKLFGGNTIGQATPTATPVTNNKPTEESAAVERGTGTGANKIAIYNAYNRETGNYTQAEFLEGYPDDNTIRYFLKPGDKLIMALAENYENLHVSVIDRSNPNNPKAITSMPFKEFMEWVTTDEATKYGYTKLTKDSPEWKTLWNNKVPMVYHLYNEETGDVDLRVAGLVHDVEWWHRNNVSQLEDPITIAREGAQQTAEERRRFFEEDKRVAEVTNVSQLGTEFFLVKKDENGNWISNVDTGETYISLEEATGATRLGVATSSSKLKLEDGTEVSLGQKHEGTNQPILLNDKLFPEGTIIEVRKIKDIGGKPVYKAYPVMIEKAVKGQPLNDTTFNTVKYILLSKIYAKTQNEDIKAFLKETFGVDINTVEALDKALKESRIGSMDGNMDEVISSFIMTVDRINYGSKGNFTQLEIKPDYIRVYHQGKVQTINFKPTDTQTVSTVEGVRNFLDLLLGSDNDGILRNTTLDVKKNKLVSKGNMFVVDAAGNVQEFKSMHGQNNYAGYIKSLVKTYVKSFKAKELDAEGNEQWITDVQPMVYVSNANSQQLIDINEIESEVESFDINDVTINGVTYDKAGLELLKEIDPEQYQLLVNNSTHYFGESDARNEFEAAPGELGLLSIPGISARELNDIGAFLFNSVLGTIEQNENNTIKPRLIYDRLMSSPEQFLTEKMNKYREIAKNLRYNPAFTTAMEPIAARYEANADKLQSVIDNKKVITDVLKLQLDELLGQEFILDAVTEGIIDSNGDYTNEIFNEDFEYGEQIEADYSKMSIEKDIRLTYSTALKIAFAGIQVKNHRGELVSGEFDLPKFEDMNFVSETVKALIVGLPSNTQMMLDKLKTASETNSNKQVSNIANEMYHKLSRSPQHVKNELLYKLAQQKLNMEMVIYSTDNKGRYTLKVQNTNSNSDIFRIRDQWRVNFLKSSFIEENENKEKILNKEYLKNFHEKVTEMQKSADTRLAENEKEFKNQVFQLFEELGISIGKNTFDNIWDNGSLIKDKSNIFGILLNQINPLIKKEEELPLDKDENNFLDRGINNKLKVLSAVELALNSAMATPSQRVAGKSYPGTSQRIMLDDISEQLFNSNSSLFNFLSQLPYSKKNYLLDIIKNTDFLSHVENAYTRVSPIAIKEQGKKDFGDSSIDKISDSDNILATLGFFQHTLKKTLSTEGVTFQHAGLAFRVGKMFSPSLSDKGQMVALTTALLDLKESNFNIVGNEVTLSNDVLDFMLVNLFDSEFDRIIHSYGNATNIKNYEQANKFFNAIPIFNDIDIDGAPLYEVIKSISEDQTISDKTAAYEELRNLSRNAAREVLNTVITKDLEAKIQHTEDGLVNGGSWVKASILSNNEKENTVDIKYVDSMYLSSKVDPSLTGLQKGKVAALDFIVNHYLFQSNMYQLYVGDMALYAPGAKKYISKDGVLDSYALSNETGQAITKRIASLIAPGSVLANSTLDNGIPAKYLQIFVNDVQAPSSIIEEYVKMVNDGVIPVDQREALEKYKSEDPVIKAEGAQTLRDMNPTITEYFDIEGTDAQEYTTWKEHLDILYGQGRISLEDKNRFFENIINDTLSPEDLKIILNPLKPVYAGMLQDVDNNVNRFVYVKSSSFPLLPQLTKGLKLDGVRIAMEKLQEEGHNVRMSYQTANKVGAIATNLSIEDFYNITPENLTDTIENKIKPNTLLLNRNSFKVQQDTPYKAKKYLEKNKNTETTMGSQMFKNLMGAGINQMGAVFPNIFPTSVLKELGINTPAGEMLTGPQLDSIKTYVETKYMQLQADNLEKEIGLPFGKSYFELPIEKRQEVFKNLIDILRNEIKTRQYDKALLKELEIDETGLETTIPIWITNNADKFESLFLSVVKNRFINIKLPGNGHIVGSSEGFERVDTFDNLSKDFKSNIVWVNPNHVGDLKATYITDKDGKKVVSESEILVQSHYIVTERDSTGKLVSRKINLLSDRDSEGNLIYVTETENGYVLNLDKIDPELLTNFSFRIPTSALQSGAILKVVGFLPENSGDLLIVPDEHTKQIGEDFDIDKRYVYKSNYKIDKATGKITKITLDDVLELEELIKDLKIVTKEEATDKLVSALMDVNMSELAAEVISDIENITGKTAADSLTKFNNLKASVANKVVLAALQNAMIDTYKSVYQSPSEEVQKKIFRILSMDVAEKTANLIDSAINVVDKTNFTFLSDEVQRKQMKSGTSGKLGTAMHSNAVTFQAQMERLERKLRITYTNKEGEIVNKEVVIGDLVSDGILGITETLDGAREVNAVHAENQNSAVDNVKANIMAKRNENSYTMPVLIQMTFRRFDQVPVTRIVDGKEITTKEQLSSLFLSQPILRRYVELLEQAKSITSDFTRDSEQVVISTLRKEFDISGFDIDNDVDYNEESKKMTGTALYKNLAGEVSNSMQLAVLRKFLELKEEAKELQEIQRVMSLSSGGLGKSYFDVLDRIEKLNSLPYSNIKNASSLIGKHKVFNVADFNEDPSQYDGYIILNDIAWKPTTSEGAMLLHSLKAAEQIMDVNYPYNRNFINKTLNAIISEKGTPLNPNNTTEFKWKVLKSLKDFMQSNPDLNYFVGDINAERHRLFNNEVKSGYAKQNYEVVIQENTHVKAINPKTGQREDGIGTLIIVNNSKGERIFHKAILGNAPIFNKFNQYVVNKSFIIKKEDNGSYSYHSYTQKVVKESLADYLHKVKQERDSKGALIHPIFATNNLLKSLDIHFNDKFNNNLGIIKHANVDPVDFNMLGKNEYFLQMLDDNTTNIGTWNGEVMTPRKLAQDLASYAYLSNQENGAIGFRQFIDTSYLKAIGYDNKLKEVLERYDDSSILQTTFLKQYYQHNPEQARILSSSNISLENFVSLDPETNKIRNNNQKPEAKLTNILKTVKEFSLVSEDGVEVNSKFLAIRDTTIKYSDNQYRLFEYLGEGLGYTEIPVLGTFGYNEYNPSDYNQTSSLTDKVFNPVNIFTGSAIENRFDNVEYVEETNMEGYYNFTNVTNFAEDIILRTEDQGVKDALRLVQPFLDSTTKIKVLDFSTIGRVNQAFYSHEDNIIYVNSKAIEQAKNVKIGIEDALVTLDKIFTEELLHSVQVNALKQYGTVKIVDHGTHKENVFTPNADAPLFVTKLMILYNEAKQVLPYNPETNENYESKDVFEFMAGSFEHRNEYREKLDSIKDEKGRSLLDRLKNIIGQTLQFLTNNYSKEVKETVLEIMKSKKGITVSNKGNNIGATIKITGTSSRPDISFVDKKEVDINLQQDGIVEDINSIVNKITDISSLSPENLLSLLEQNNIIKKEC